MVTCPWIRSLAMDFDCRTRDLLAGTVDCEDKIDRLVGLNKLMREVWLDCYNIIYVVLLYQSIDGEKRERYNIISVVINRPLPWRVRLHGRSKPHLIKSSIFWVLGGDGPAFFSILGFWAGLLPCVRVFLFFFFFLISLSKVKKTQNLLVLHNAKKLSIHYPIQTSVARIAAPYAAHPKGSLKQKVNCKFAIL